MYLSYATCKNSFLSPLLSQGGRDANQPETHNLENLEFCTDPEFTAC